MVQHQSSELNEVDSLGLGGVPSALQLWRAKSRGHGWHGVSWCFMIYKIPKLERKRKLEKKCMSS